MNRNRRNHSHRGLSAGARTAACIILILGACSAVLSAEKLCSVFDCGKNLSSLLYEVRDGRAVNRIMGGRLASDVSFYMKQDRKSGNWVLFTKSSYHEAVSIVDSLLRTREHTYRMKNEQVAKYVRDPEIKKLMLNMDYDGYRALWDWNRRVISLDYFKAGKRVKSETIGFSGQLLDVGHLYAYLQAMLLSGSRKDFESEVFITSKAWKVKVGFHLLKTDRPTELNPSARQRKEMLPAFIPGKSYYVYEMKPIGFLGFFARLVMGIKYHVAYESWPPFRFVAIWGGPRDHEDLTWIPPSGKR